METEFDFCARRAAEEFLAAGRATSAAQRLVHRQLAEKYAEVVRQLMDRRRNVPRNMMPPAMRQGDAQAA